jgi:hypothetical protein
MRFAQDVIAVPIMTVMMLPAAKPNVTGQFVVSTCLRILDWIATGVMALAVLGMGITSLR